MKTVLFLAFMTIFAGCASVSEYGQGCRDGLEGANHALRTYSLGINRDSRDKACDTLEQIHNNRAEYTNRPGAEK